MISEPDEGKKNFITIVKLAQLLILCSKAVTYKLVCNLYLYRARWLMICRLFLKTSHLFTDLVRHDMGNVEFFVKKIL